MRSSWPCVCGLVTVVLGLACVDTSAQSIKISSVPSYGVDGSVTGRVSGVDFATHRVTMYIQIEGLGWSTRPTAAVPSVPIDTGGTFEVDLGVGNRDNRATIICAALIESTADPPLALGAVRFPKGLPSLATVCVERYSRTLEFAGFNWAVKEAPQGVGPRGNRFSDRLQDVFVDEKGRLHLRIVEREGAWWATEVILLEHLGYGTYAFQTESELDDLDENATFGAFTWDAYGEDDSVPGRPHREIDYEDSRWGNASDPHNAQMVVQPSGLPGNLRRYTIPDLRDDARLTRFFTWEPGRIEWVALRGHHDPFDFPAASIIDRFVYENDRWAGHYVPSSGRERFRFNLWLNNTGPGGIPSPEPARKQPVEVVITDFSHVRKPAAFSE